MTFFHFFFTDFSPNLDKFPTPESREAARATTHRAPSLRAKVWKVLIMGPYLLQKYSVKESDAHHRSASQYDSSSNPTQSPMATTTGVAPAGFPQTNSTRHSTQPSLPHSQFSLHLGLDSSDSKSTPLYSDNFVSAEEYIELVRRGPSERYHLVRDDSFRTFRTKGEDNQFWSVVPEQAIVRVCNAFDLKFSKSHKIEYCQGMNVYAGVFLYVMPELDAFNMFSIFCTEYIPMYWKSNHIGVEAGCAIMDSIVEKIDPAIHNHFKQCNPPLKAILHSFHAIKTMCASTPPLTEVVRLWDFILAMGPYVSILCVIAQVLAMRQRILKSDYPKDILDYRRWPLLRSKYIIAVVMAILPLVPTNMLQHLLEHSSNNDIVEHLTKRKNYKDYKDMPKVGIYEEKTDICHTAYVLHGNLLYRNSSGQLITLPDDTRSVAFFAGNKLTEVLSVLKPAADGRVGIYLSNAKLSKYCDVSMGSRNTLSYSAPGTGKKTHLGVDSKSAVAFFLPEYYQQTFLRDLKESLL